jgi:hypothetical protein
MRQGTVLRWWVIRRYTDKITHEKLIQNELFKIIIILPSLNKRSDLYQQKFHSRKFIKNYLIFDNEFRKTFHLLSYLNEFHFTIFI